MYPYLNLLRQTLKEGVRQKNRTGIDTFMIPGGMMQFDFRLGFPILTTKKVNFDAIKAELIGFIRGYTSAADFRILGTKIWDANANKNEQWLKNPYRKGEDDLGPIYGKQWRRWASWHDSDSIENRPYAVYTDQLAKAVDTILRDPTSRRIIISAWQPGELQMMALPPCHLLYQFLVGQEEKELHCTMYMRSCDMFLGVPFNISSYALLLAIIAKATGYKPGKLTMFLADVHIYENHLEQVKEQLDRWPRPKPKLHLEMPFPVVGKLETSDAMSWIENLSPTEIVLEGYDPHPAIKAEMAV